jgi:hypothetical protein
MSSNISSSGAEADRTLVLRHHACILQFIREMPVELDVLCMYMYILQATTDTSV